MPEDLLDQPAPALVAALRDGEISATSLVAACLERIAARESDIEAWAFLDQDMVLAQATALDALRQSGAPLGPLHGLPVGVKDIIDTADMPTENGTPIQRGRRPAVDAVLAARLRAAGAIVMGKTVTSELAVYTPGKTRNPHDLSRTPGGSSSGSAAAVAAGMVPLTLATQTNASTIRPASFCGVVGYKPSLGLLPRTGILHQSSVLDQPGLMARDVAGVTLLAGALMGPDPADRSTAGVPIPQLTGITSPGPTPRLAFVRSPYWERVDATARTAFEDFAARLEISTIELPPDFDAAAAIHTTIMVAGIAEAYGGLYRENKSQMSPLLADMIERGFALSATELVAALDARNRLQQLFVDAAAPYDAIVTPASVGVAPKLTTGSGNPIMSTLWTLLGAPALTLPLLAGDEGLPLGVQLVGKLQGDTALIGAALWLEQHGSARPVQP